MKFGNFSSVFDDVPYAQARDAFLPLRSNGAELVCHYIMEKVRETFRHRWLQGCRSSPLPCASSSARVRLFAEHRLCSVPEAAASALCAWADGKRPVELLFSIPTPRQVLALQARGRRCVSLLEEDQVPVSYQNGVEFVLHDLCHIEKFTDPTHYAGQVGFFSSMERALLHPGWRELGQRLDAAWESDFIHVIADMNGSPVFLWVALRARLQQAVRRLERSLAGLAPQGKSFDSLSLLQDVLEWFQFPPQIRKAALTVSHKNSDFNEACQLLGYFQEVGMEVLNKNSDSTKKVF